jgi:lipoate-protein ligase A
MAVDEALLASVQHGAPPTLRFYSWDRAWLSLGFAQRLDGGRAAACRAAGVGVVRRATGGRAVLHGADLTYAVAAPADQLPAGLQATYACLGEALRRGLAALGIPSERPGADGPEPARGAFDCFQSPAAEELCVAGRKLVGSAQRRSGTGVLQHGSLRLGPDPRRAREAAGLLPDGATSLAELGHAIEAARVREALAEAFADVLGVRLEPGALDDRERARAAALAAERASPEAGAFPSGFSI